MLTFGVDLSEWQQALAPGFWQEVREKHGIIATVQLHGGGPDGLINRNDYAQHQLGGAREQALDLSGYVLVKWTDDYPGHVQVAEGLAAAGPFAPHLLFVAIDIEVHTNWKASPVQYRIPRVLEALEEVRRRGLYPIVYTNKGMFETVMGGTPQDWGLIVNRTEIWYAHPGQPDFSTAWAAAPWPADRIVGRQFSANTVQGDSIDNNVWLLSWIEARRWEREARLAPPPPPPAPPAPPPAPVDVCAELRAKLDRVRQIVG